MSKVIIITGASAGIGRETARQLVQSGNIVYGAARRADRLQNLQAPGFRALEMDVTNEQSMVAGVEQILNEQGRIDVLINNAGFGSLGALEDVPLADARYQMEVNLFGPARLIQLVLPSMIAQRSGKIVNISSIGGKIATAFGSWYHASKFALEGLSDSLRNEVKQFGVDIILIEPGGIKTEWADIAAENLLKVSGEGCYNKIAAGLAKTLSQEVSDASADPQVIARIIEDAITADVPETRYAAGYMAEELLSARKTLSDRAFDEMLHSQLNIG